MIITEQSSVVNNSQLSTSNFQIEASAFLYKTLYSSLYENKVKAVLQELAANALDAHISAGCTDIPIEIHLPNDLHPELVVRDFGIGMSKDTLETLYTTYGKSTKRDSNTGIGGFGIGSKSPFAISSSFTVESTKDGNTTTAGAFLDEGIPKFVVFTHEKTGLPNGTTIRVPVTNDEQQKEFFRTAEYLFVLWKTLPKITATGSTVKVTQLSDVILHSTPEYVIANRIHEVSAYSVSIGPYLYAIPSLLVQRLFNDVPDLRLMYELKVNDCSTTLFPVTPIGHLELSPNREKIENTEDNYQKLYKIFSKITTDTTQAVSTDVATLYKKLVDTQLNTGIRLAALAPTFTANKILFENSSALSDVLKTVYKADSNPLLVAYIKHKYLHSTSAIVEVLVTSKEKALNRYLDLRSDFFDIDLTAVSAYRLSTSATKYLAANGFDIDKKNAMVLTPAPDKSRTLYSIMQTLKPVTFEETSRGTLRRTSGYYGYLNADIVLTDASSYKISRALKSPSYTKTTPVVTVITCSKTEEASFKRDIETVYKFFGKNPPKIYGNDDVTTWYAAIPKATKTSRKGKPVETNKQIGSICLADGSRQKVFTEDFFARVKSEKGVLKHVMFIPTTSSLYLGKYNKYKSALFTELAIIIVASNVRTSVWFSKYVEKLQAEGIFTSALPNSFSSSDIDACVTASKIDLVVTKAAMMEDTKRELTATLIDATFKFNSYNYVTTKVAGLFLDLPSASKLAFSATSEMYELLVEKKLAEKATTTISASLIIKVHGFVGIYIQHNSLSENKLKELRDQLFSKPELELIKTTITTLVNNSLCFAIF